MANLRFGDERRFGVIAIELSFLTDDHVMRYLEMWARRNSGGIGESPASQSPGD